MARSSLKVVIACSRDTFVGMTPATNNADCKKVQITREQARAMAKFLLSLPPRNPSKDSAEASSKG
tara:strand:- start:1965 stop:2162 length:198 start_codon:yes stop_codon:yes gene_type:complete